MIATALLFSISIASVTPSSGPTSGGTTVLIRGTGLGAANPRAVSFGALPAQSFQVIDADTISAVTPPYFPGSVSVSVSDGDFVSLPNGFTYTGEIGDGFERVLLPIYKFAPGAFGSQFTVFFSAWTAGDDIPMFAFPGPPCNIGVCPPTEGPGPVLLTRRSPPLISLPVDGDPGRLIYIPKGSFQRLSASLRVADLSRRVQSLGSMTPIVPEGEFRSDLVSLATVPIAPGYRYTLRIYSLDPQTSVHVRVVRFDGAVVYSEMDVDLRDPADLFHPGYAQVPEFNAGADRDVFIDVAPGNGKRIWAFVSITNNDTQQITVIAPH